MKTPGSGRYEAKDYWKGNPQGAFRKCKRVTEAEEVTLKSKHVPGPGKYDGSPVGFKKIKGGRSSRSEGTDFLSNT